MTAPASACRPQSNRSTVAGVCIRSFGGGEVDCAARNDGGDGVLVYHLRHCVAQQHDILIEGLNLPLKLDAIDQIDGHRHMFPTQSVKEGVLQKLAFIAHDILRVQNVVVIRHLTTPRTSALEESGMASWNCGLWLRACHPSFPL